MFNVKLIKFCPIPQEFTQGKVLTCAVPYGLVVVNISTVEISLPRSVLIGVQSGMGECVVMMAITPKYFGL